MRHSRRERGFTLIELLIVVVIIGILAAIAIPKFSSARERAMMTKVITDLKNFATYQEEFHGQNTTYASSVAAVTDMVVSQGVNISVNQADGRGWAATAWHDGLVGRQCGIYYGVASAGNAAPAAVAGVIACDP